MAKSKLKIAKEVFEFWKKNIRRGDRDRLAELLGLSHPTIDRALKHGDIIDTKNITKISDYFRKRLEKETASIPDNK